MLSKRADVLESSFQHFLSHQFLSFQAITFNMAKVWRLNWALVYSFRAARQICWLFPELLFWLSPLLPNKLIIFCTSLLLIFIYSFLDSIHSINASIIQARGGGGGGGSAEEGGIWQTCFHLLYRRQAI